MEVATAFEVKSEVVRAVKAEELKEVQKDSNGRLYVASTFDPGNDNGPFRNVVWEVERIILNSDEPALALDTYPICGSQQGQGRECGSSRTGRQRIGTICGVERRELWRYHAAAQIGPIRAG